MWEPCEWNNRGGGSWCVGHTLQDDSILADLGPRIPPPERMKEMADRLEDVVEGPHNFRTYHILKIAKELRDAAG